MTEPAPSPSNNEDPLVGSQIDEYEVLSLVGHGAMARVYLALDTRLRRYVALKLIDHAWRDSNDYRERFQREALAVGRLEHPHIVRLYRYGEQDGLLYMAMQYVEGVELSAVMLDYQRDNVYMPLVEVSRLIGEIGQALDYAHGQGVIHRDVKPGNILVSSNGHAILSDFGLALPPGVEAKGEAFGTPHYMAPEQVVSSANAGPLSDLYSLGVILYEMVTNRLPFDAPDPVDVALLHLNDPPPSPRQFRPEISPELEELILRMLAKDPSERCQSGAALTRALKRVAQTTPDAPPTLPFFSFTDRVTAQLNIVLPSPLPAAVAVPPAQPAETTGQLPLSSLILPPLALPHLSPSQRQTLFLAGGCLLLVTLLALLSFGFTRLVRALTAVPPEAPSGYSLFLPLVINNGTEPAAEESAAGHPQLANLYTHSNNASPSSSLTHSQQQISSCLKRQSECMITVTLYKRVMFKSFAGSNPIL
jgi:serine/threonine protein kinase